MLSWVTGIVRSSRPAKFNYRGDLPLREQVRNANVTQNISPNMEQTDQRKLSRPYLGSHLAQQLCIISSSGRLLLMNKEASG